MKNLTKGNRTKIQICSLINLQQNSPLFRHIGQKLIQKQNVTIKIKKELLQYRYAFYHFWLHDFLLRESPLSTACMKPMDYGSVIFYLRYIDKTFIFFIIKNIQKTIWFKL